VSGVGGNPSFNRSLIASALGAFKPIVEACRGLLDGTSTTLLCGGELPLCDRIRASPIRCPATVRNSLRSTAPLKVNAVVAIEYWPFDRPMPRGILPAPVFGLASRRMRPNYSWVEYGMRCGLPRIFDLFKRRGIEASARMYAQCADVYRSAAERAASDGWNFVGHCWCRRSLREVEDEETALAFAA
jgi:hypothetical protein